jgi:hypothetical protein
MTLSIHYLLFAKFRILTRREEPMSCVFVHQPLQWNRVHNLWSSVARVVATLLLCCAPQAALAQAEADFEKPPVLAAKDLVAEKLLTGQGVRVESQVPTDGVMGTFTIHADADTYHDNAGTYHVRGHELFTIRMGELPAIVQLEETSKTATFAKSVGASAARPVKAAGHMIMNPVDTVTGLPSGVGRLFERVGTGAGNIWEASTDPDQSGLKQAGTATRDALGYEQERRELAKKLGVDPYTTNPVLARKLDEIAWVSFAGRLGVSAAMAVAVPGSMIITGVRTVDNLVWDTPRGDLIVRVETKLKEMKVPEASSRAFMHNPAIPLSLQASIVENLGRLTNASGRAGVIALTGGLVTESQTRFVASAVRMLADYHEKTKPITAVVAPGPVIGRNRDGVLILPAPVDYISWTERVASFATSPDLKASQRTILLSGKMSPRAGKEFEALGWTVRETAS